MKNLLLVSALEDASLLLQLPLNVIYLLSGLGRFENAFLRALLLGNLLGQLLGLVLLLAELMFAFFLAPLRVGTLPDLLFSLVINIRVLKRLAFLAGFRGNKLNLHFLSACWRLEVLSDLVVMEDETAVHADLWLHALESALPRPEVFELRLESTQTSRPPHFWASSLRG